jgi:hypothetical protein
MHATARAAAAAGAMLLLLLLLLFRHSLKHQVGCHTWILVES